MTLCSHFTHFTGQAMAPFVSRVNCQTHTFSWLTHRHTKLTKCKRFIDTRLQSHARPLWHCVLFPQVLQNNRWGLRWVWKSPAPWKASRKPSQRSRWTARSTCTGRTRGSSGAGAATRASGPRSTSRTRSPAPPRRRKRTAWTRVSVGNRLFCSAEPEHCAHNEILALHSTSDTRGNVGQLSASTEPLQNCYKDSCITSAGRCLGCAHINIHIVLVERNCWGL